MVHRFKHTWLLYLLPLLLFTACGGGGSAIDSSAGGSITQGIAVDPYIVGAVFYEIDADSGVVLQESAPSDESGMFSFAEPLTPGSVVELIPNTGLHGGAPYQGMLRRIVETDDVNPLVVSPLTTLLANGGGPEEFIATLNNAGLTGLSISDLYADPMEGLAEMTVGVTYQELDFKPLQASMAANAYMEITGDFQTGVNELNDAEHFQIFSSMLDSMVNLLNVETFLDISETLSMDPDVSTEPILEDYILAVLAQQQTIVSLVRNDMADTGIFHQAMVEQGVADAMENSTAMVKASYHQRIPSADTYDGTGLYHDNCSACHNILANSEIPGSTAADIQTAVDNNIGNMGYLNTLTPGEIAAIADVLPPAPTPEPVAPGPAPSPDPTAPLDGVALYSSDCAVCHGQLSATSKPGRTAADIQGAIDNNIGNMGYLNYLTSEEVQAIADELPPAPTPEPVAPGPAPSPDPTAPLDGVALYSSDCAVCHGQLSATSKPGRTAADIQGAIDNNIGNMGYLNYLTSEEVQAIADELPQAANPGPGPDYSDCTSCHGQPPSGNSYPDTAGAHAVHTALASVGGDCSICHLDAAHNSQVDLGFPATFDASSGPAVDNLDGTCSSVKCHGGQTTPDWWSGSIAADTQCTSCHTSGSSQFNSYSSGRHSKHVDGEGYSCTVCHNTAALDNGHFSNLETSSFELSPAATIGGGSTRVGSYSNGTCSNIACHGNKNW